MQSNDELHKRRKYLEEKMRDGLMTVDKMNWRDIKNDSNAEIKRVGQYDRWKRDNQPRMDEWNKINREMKSRGEEGRVHTMNDIRNGRRIKYD